MRTYHNHQQEDNDMPLIPSLQHIFTEWVQMNQNEARQKGLYPNRIYYDIKSREVVVVTQRGAGGGYATSHGAITRYATKVRNGGTHQCYIVQIDESGTILRAATVLEVEKKVKGYTPNPSQFEGGSPYYWLTETFSVSEIKEFSGGTSPDFV